MGDAAFGMTGLDFETAVRSHLPIITVVLNNSTMAAETRVMATSHELFNTRDLGGNYADMGRAMGGYAERIEDPAEIISCFPAGPPGDRGGGHGGALGVHYILRDRGIPPGGVLETSEFSSQSLMMATCVGTARDSKSSPRAAIVSFDKLRTHGLTSTGTDWR